MTTIDVPFGLEEVKLAPPVVRAGTVPKSGVIASVRASTAAVATVIAPAGYGKTTLLGRWAEADPRPFAWVALDAAEDDPVLLLRYIVASLHRLEPFPLEVLEAVSGRGGGSWTRRIPRIGGALATRDRSLVLALDDLHTISNRSCLDLLAELVQYVPPGSQIVIASREEPALPLARWRAHGLVHEIGVADLRMDETESAQLIEAAGAELEPADLAELTTRTEGWAAGLYLAALSSQAGGSTSVSAAGFDGDDRFVSDYLRSELLSRLPEGDARFLTYTSVLDRMCGGLCDAVLQSTGSAQRLEADARRNGFIVPLDRRGHWYRYHHLFRQLLRNELERSEPAMVEQLNRRAMAWCIANDMPEAAAAYGHAAGATDAVASVVAPLFHPLYADGRMETLQSWLAWFSEEELTRFPTLPVYGAWFCVLSGEPDDAERWLTLAGEATQATSLPDGSATIEPWVAVLRALMMQNGPERALADADLALDRLAPASYWRPITLCVRAATQSLMGETGRAVEGFMETMAAALSVGVVPPVYVSQAELALLAIKRGSWDEAARWARDAGETKGLLDKAGLVEYSPTALGDAVAARVAVHEARYDDARSALTRAHRIRPLLDHGMPWLTVQVGLELVRVHLALTDVAAARTILRETEHVLQLRPDLGNLGDEVRELRDLVDASAGPAGAWAMSLTAAELRLLPYLATHLTIPEIATRLYISRNTVKTEAVSIYRKLTASSRSEAIARAVEVGLLDSSIYPASANTQIHA